MVSYFTGDSFCKNSRRLGSRPRRGSCGLGLLPLSPEEEDPQNQPIVGRSAVVEFVVVGLRSGSRSPDYDVVRVAKKKSRVVARDDKAVKM